MVLVEVNFLGVHLLFLQLCSVVSPHSVCDRQDHVCCGPVQSPYAALVIFPTQLQEAP